MKTITIKGHKIQMQDEAYTIFKEELAKYFELQEATENTKDILWKSEYEYFYVDEIGNIGDSCWDEHRIDFGRLSLGNVYKTKKAAQEAIDTGWIAKRKAEVEILRFIAENDLEFEPDWQNENEWKYTLYYNSQDNSFTCRGLYFSKYCLLPVFKSQEDAQLVIDNCTPQLKVLFGIKEDK